MKKTALCIYTDDPSYKAPDNILPNGDDYELFTDYNSNLFIALRNVSVKKRFFELKNNEEFDMCIAFDPRRADINDLNISTVKHNTIHYAYGSFNRGKFVVAANPSLFYSGTVEFNRACEFIDNFTNINDPSVDTVFERFIFHIRSLYLKDECFNYENSSLFIRPT